MSGAELNVFGLRVDTRTVGLAPRAQLILRVLALVVLLALGAYVAHLGLGLGGSNLDWLFNDFVYNGLIASAAAACLLRAALVCEERLPWLVMGLGIVSSLAGEVYWTLALADLDEPPYPSIADALYLGFYPASYVALVLLVRSRVGSFSRSLWLDGAIAALAVGALATALALQPIIDATSGSTAAVVTTMAYPVGDLTLLALTVAVFGLSGWRPGRAWVMLGAGLVVMAVADGIYLVQAAKGTYVEGTLLDGLWPAAMLLVGLSAWQPARMGAAPEIGGSRMVAVPFLSALVAVGLLTYDHFERLNVAGIVLASATLLAVTVRMAMAFMENQRMLTQSQAEALTDGLTGLNNRRSLMIDLEREVAAATPEDPRAVLVFDLDGFKLYNDTFGHPAGDQLLARLGRRLGAALGPHDTAYRMGGDEFCALVRPGTAGLEPIMAAASAALSEHGEGFSVASSHGVVMVPGETPYPSAALQLADRRMFAEKGGRRGSPGRQSRDVLLRALRERQPDLHEHLNDVADLALEIGRRFEMAPEGLDELARAAELHDVGKVAIPDAILTKRGPLDESEWAFMARHTIIGERILLAAPALRPVAGIVRSSHERWDGGGYPDGLAGEDIPLAARIVCVCDAFHAMTSDRPYGEALSEAAALAELRRNAGEQFDPSVVDTFCDLIGEGEPLPSDAFTRA
jgi:two-component system, cell cycle response regulator